MGNAIDVRHELLEKRFAESNPEVSGVGGGGGEGEGSGFPRVGATPCGLILLYRGCI